MMVGLRADPVVDPGEGEGAEPGGDVERDAEDAAPRRASMPKVPAA